MFLKEDSGYTVENALNGDQSAGASQSFHTGKPFPTDHDTSGRNGTVSLPGAWWHGSCYQTNLNGRYLMFKAPAHSYSIERASRQGVGHPYHRD
ncbi:hypothetical protein CapIbe_001716 [Capra ibex]